MKIIRSLFSVRLAALVLVACTLFTGVMYRRQARELRQAEHSVSLFDTHIDNEQKLAHDVRNGMDYSSGLEKRLKAYEAAYPQPEDAPPRVTKPARLGELLVLGGNCCQ